jgi:histidyl-tRNA synthetase
MVAAHERSYKKPIKWFAIPQLYRYERQQKGRLREHFQLNADIIGESDPAADAELIALLIDTLRSFQFTSDDFVVRLSSRNAWHDYFVSRNGEPAKEYEFYQIIDKLEREKPEISAEKLKAINFSLEDVTAFVEKGEPTAELQSILDNLAARGLKDFVKIDYHVIRGLAYYTGVVFEAFALGEDLRAISGGGRYDNLVKLISGGKVDLPALGFGMGDVVLLELLKARGLLPKFDGGIDVFCLIEDETLRPDSLKLIHNLRSHGLSVEYSLTKAKSDKQFKRAQELKASRTVRLERSSAGEVTVKLKDLRTREERTLEVEQLVKELSGSS